MESNGAAVTKVLSVLLAQFDVDAAEAYREASRSTLIVSDSYLVFFNSKEYRIVNL